MELCISFYFFLFYRLHSDVSQRVKKKVTLRHSLDGEPGCSQSGPLEESCHESPSGSLKEGHAAKDCEHDSPALSVVMHSPVKTELEQPNPDTPQDSCSVDVPDDGETQTELPLEEKPSTSSETFCDSTAKKDEETDRGDNAL